MDYRPYKKISKNPPSEYNMYFQKLRNFVDFLLIEPVNNVKYASQFSHTYF